VTEFDRYVERLTELESRYQDWAAAVNQAVRESMSKATQEGAAPGERGRRILAIREEARARYDPYEAAYVLFDSLCPAYLAATPAEQSALRRAVRDKYGVVSALRGYVYRAAKRLQSPSDLEWLRRGLAAASLDDCSQDYRDFLLALAELYVAAEKAGIKPRSEFKAVARLSSSQRPKGGRTPVREILDRFHTYGVLRERRGRSRLSRRR
jgi:hypothetical protein